MESRKLVVADLTGTIYDTKLTRSGKMSSDRVERTKECVVAVANHMMLMANQNDAQPGFIEFKFNGHGTLTWRAEGGAVTDGEDKG